ncbi:MAG: hypothetical protein ACAI35_04240 [Candidatus Methylacidiphilales bacterium]|nr:hypothetical protein [Candidatus Methylacidiphilales bacterium]
MHFCPTFKLHESMPAIMAVALLGLCAWVIQAGRVSQLALSASDSDYLAVNAPLPTGNSTTTTAAVVTAPVADGYSEETTSATPQSTATPQAVIELTGGSVTVKEILAREAQGKDKEKELPSNDPQAIKNAKPSKKALADADAAALDIADIAMAAGGGRAKPDKAKTTTPAADKGAAVKPDPKTKPKPLAIKNNDTVDLESPAPAKPAAPAPSAPAHSSPRDQLGKPMSASPSMRLTVAPTMGRLSMPSLPATDMAVESALGETNPDKTRAPRPTRPKTVEKTINEASIPTAAPASPVAPGATTVAPGSVPNPGYAPPAGPGMMASIASDKKLLETAYTNYDNKTGVWSAKWVKPKMFHFGMILLPSIGEKIIPGQEVPTIVQGQSVIFKKTEGGIVNVVQNGKEEKLSANMLRTLLEGKVESEGFLLFLDRGGNLILETSGEQAAALAGKKP